jgi:glutathione peroxidase|tara:strand:+ start:146 stop:505 length:360 start_codon:yes stop_codon:yes gene_type:complete
LRTLQEEFSDYPFTVLAFPCNQFGAQEPGSDAEVLEFATTKYQANFPIFSKINVNGSQACELYAFLKGQRADEEGNADIPWNFAKFLVDGTGEVIGRFSPQTAPEELKTVILETVEAST